MDFTKCVTLVGALLLLGVCLPSEACKCVLVDHPQWHFCRSEAMIKATFLKPSEKALTSEMNEAGVGYDSQTLEVLRGDEALQSSTYIDSHMADSSCKFSFEDKIYGIPYIVGGDYVNGNVGVWSCGYLRSWSELTAMQITGLEKTYKEGCGKCDIINCRFGCKPRNNACILQEEGGVDFEKQQNQACLLNEDTCAWTTFQ